MGPESPAGGGRTFFTYVWGPPGEPAWPLTFSSKGARTQALNVLSEGDTVYLVGTQREPTRPEHRGRVLAAFQASRHEVDTRDYAHLGNPLGDPAYDNAAEFPFALHPLAAWEITAAETRFARLVGSLEDRQHLRAQAYLVEIEGEQAEALRVLERRPLAIGMPLSEAARSLIKAHASRLAPAHKGSFEGAFAERETWWVYALALRDAKGKTLAVKVGYASDPGAREADYNRGLAPEVTGLRWRLAVRQATTSEDAARAVEQAVLSHFDAQRLPSNGEILQGVTPEQVLSAALDAMVAMKA